MRLTGHRLSAAAFETLAAGGGGRDVLRELADAQYSKHMLLLRGVVAAAENGDREEALRVRRACALLTAAQRRNPTAARLVIGHPAVGAWALRAVRASPGDRAVPGAIPDGLSCVAAAAAIRSGLQAEIEVAAAEGTVVLPSLGAFRTSASSAIVRTTGEAAEIISAGSRVRLPMGSAPSAPGWIALRRIKLGSSNVLVDDVDPFRMPAVPDVSSPLNESEFRAWDRVFQDSWLLLVRHHPAVTEEAAEAIRVIVPLEMPSQGERSSSSPETFGAIALSRPRNATTLAVTLTHELQHLKLCALIDLVSLTRRDEGRRYYAPWRDDPRPASGLLQGAYAYLGITGFWRRQRLVTSGESRIRANAEFAKWRAAAAQATATLAASGEVTEEGARFVHGMARTLEAWGDDLVPSEAGALARHEADEHRARWTQAHGSIPT
jgi:HEXXH motif-containing protein